MSHSLEQQEREGMGSETLLQIPRVDLSAEELKNPGSHAWDAARAQVLEALECYGCFEAVYDGVPPELREAAFAAMEELFALPIETKLRNRSDKTYHGYIGRIPGLPYESLAVEDVLQPGEARSFTDLMWPGGNPNFCETVCSFAKKVSELDLMVRRMILEILGVEKYYESHIESTNYRLRFSEYAAPQSGETKITLPSHVDGNISTLIHQNQVDGFEMQAKSGDWIPIKPSSPNSFVFLTGDAFRAWSNDRLFSPQHRVRVSGEVTRYTVMLFSIPNDDFVIQAPEELVDEDHPLRFGPYRYPDYVKFTLADGAQAKCALTAFCGIGGDQQSAE